jgi:hypothetical protein
MFHPMMMQFLVDEHVETLRRDAARPIRASERKPAADTRDVELRLCRIGDDPELERLAGLEGRPLPFGRLVLAVIRGRIVAALPVRGGCALADPFTRTEHILPLLELRAAQLREPKPRGRLFPRYASLIRGSTHA